MPTRHLGPNSMQGDSCILIVEDCDLVAQALRTFVKDLGIGRSCHARTVGEAVALASRHRPLLILMDLELEGIGDGVDAAERIHADQNCPIIFLTGNTAPTAMRRIFHGQPAAVLKKPFSAEALERSIQDALKRQQSSRNEGGPR